MDARSPRRRLLTVLAIFAILPTNPGTAHLGDHQPDALCHACGDIGYELGYEHGYRDGLHACQQGGGGTEHRALSPKQPRLSERLHRHSNDYGLVSRPEASCYECGEIGYDLGYEHGHAHGLFACRPSGGGTEHGMPHGLRGGSRLKPMPY